MMAEQPNKPPLASVEADLFGALLGFHKKTMTLVRESLLDAVSPTLGGGFGWTPPGSSAS